MWVIVSVVAPPDTSGTVTAAPPNMPLPLNALPQNVFQELQANVVEDSDDDSVVEDSDDDSSDDDDEI